MFKYLFFTSIMLLFAATVWAEECYTHTIIINGKMQTWLICCDELTGCVSRCVSGC